MFLKGKILPLCFLSIACVRFNGSRKMLWNHIKNLMLIDEYTMQYLWGETQNPTTSFAFLYWMYTKGIRFEKEKVLGIKREGSENPRYIQEAKLFDSIFDESLMIG